MVRDNFNENEEDINVFDDQSANEADSSVADEAPAPPEAEAEESIADEGVEFFTEKEDVDDTEDKKAKKSKKNVMGKLKIPIIIVCVILVLATLVVVKGMMSKPKDNVYTITNAILTNELGTFDYIIDIRSGEAGTLNTQSNANVDLNNLQQVENIDIEGEETEGEDKNEKEINQKSTNVDWSDASGIKEDYWKYPNFKIQIKGTTMSTDPLETTVTVNLSTDYHSGTFTEIIVKDGKYYINTEDMRKWLAGSKDNHFIEISKLIPENSPFAVFDEKDFAYVSRYAEIGEKDFATTKNLRDLYVKTVLLTDTVIQYVRNDGATSTDKEGTSTIELTGDKGIEVAKQFKQVILNIDSMYDRYCNSVKSTYNKSDEDMQQMYREKDNIIRAFQNSQVLVGTFGTESTNMNVKGTSRKFTNGSGSQQMEAAWYIAYTLNNKDVQMSISLSRSGDKTEIVVPTDTYQLSEDSLGMPAEVINKCLDYLNPTSIQLGYQTEITPNSIADKVVDDFITLVNEAETYDKYLTRDNFTEYLEKYANYVEDESTTRGDQINAQLVADFFNTLNSITGGVVKEVEKEEVITTPKYTPIVNKILVDDKSIDVTANINEEESKTNLIVIDLTLLYKTEVSDSAELDSDEVVDDSIEVNLSDFSLHTLLKSTYPANNSIILKDNGISSTDYEETVKVQPNIKGEYKLYIVVNTDEYMDLWYNNSNLGEIINH